MLLFLLVGLCLAGCSSRATPADSGPRWPDLRRDRGGAADRGAAADGGAPALDLWRADGVGPDGGSPRGWVQAKLRFRALYDVACVQGHVFAVGAGGEIYHHSPGAPPRSFSHQSSGAGEDLYTVSFADSDGAVWAPVVSGSGAELRAVDLYGALEGWAAGSGGVILHTGDGGLTWDPQESGTGADLNGICFTSADAGWAVGAGGTLLTTTSGGAR